MDNFDGLWSSDLKRSYVFADIATGFQGDDYVKKDKRLRELNFGDDEGKLYDTMSEAEQHRIDSINYRAPNGESWTQVGDRFAEFMGEKEQGSSHMVFTHGGAICALTYHLGIEDIITNSSCVGLTVDKEGRPEDIVFDWEFPLEEM